MKKYGFTRRGQKALCVAMFFGFVIIGMIGTRWQGAFIRPWYKIDIPLSSTEEAIHAPYLLPLGDVDTDQYPDFLIYDGFEKSKVIHNPGSPLPATKDGRINASVDILIDLNYFETYNYSGMGIYSLVSQSDTPIAINKRDFQNLDILFCKLMADLNNDDVQEIFVALAEKREIPQPEQFGYSTMKSLLKENHWLFNELFIMENQSQELQITPQYIQYNLMVLDGANLNILDTSERQELGIEQHCPMDFALLNKTDDSFGAQAVLLTSNVSLTRISGQGEHIVRNSFDYDYSLYGLSFNEFQVVWDKKPEDFGADDTYQIPGTLIGMDPGDYANVTLNNAYRAELESFGEEFVLRYTVDSATIFDGGWVYQDYWIGEKSFFSVYDGQTADRMWAGNYSIQYITKNLDLRGAGVGQVFACYNQSDDINIIMLNGTNGVPISKAILMGNDTRLITGGNFDFMRFEITNDDIYGDDGFSELFIVALNGSSYNFFQPGNDYVVESQHIQVARLGLNDSNDVRFEISAINKDAPASIYLDGWTEWYVKSTNVDFDLDGILDYLVFSANQHHRSDKIVRDSYENSPILAVSGVGINLHRRYFESAIGLGVEEKSGYQFDFREFEETTFFFHDIKDEDRVSLVNVNTEEFVYVQDINIFEPNLGFVDYFEGANIIMYVLGGLFALSVIIAATQVSKKREIIEENVEAKDKELVEEKVDSRLRETQELNKVVLVSAGLAFIIVAATTYFFTKSIDLTIGYTDVVISPEGQLIWFLLLYPAVFGLLAVIPDLFNFCAPIFAEKVFINGQRAFYKPFVKSDRKDYRIVVIDMKEKDEVSSVTRISRMLLPFLISITIGITIYQGLGEDGFIYNALSSAGMADLPLTNPTVLGIMTDQMTSADDIWVEIGKFARYCILPMIVTYGFTAILIPGSWLLDDTGVCYYQQALKYREISDVDSISKWTLSLVSGLFGFTAVVSFVGLFEPMLTQIDELIFNISSLTEDPAIFGVTILISALIVFPILIGVLLMFASMRRMEETYDINAEKLYKRMEKQGIDTTPHDLKSVLKAEVPREESRLFEGLELKKILGEDYQPRISKEAEITDKINDYQQTDKKNQHISQEPELETVNFNQDSGEYDATSDVDQDNGDNAVGRTERIKQIDFESKYDQYDIDDE